MKREVNTKECRLVEEAPNLTTAVVRLHKVKQRASVEVLKTIWNPLIIGWMQGIQCNNPVMLREYLSRAGILFSYEESRNLFRFIKRLLDALKRENVSRLL